MLFLLTGNADVGDDVYGEDPTVNGMVHLLCKAFGKTVARSCLTMFLPAELEKYACEMFQKPAALYFVSGTQGNLCAILGGLISRIRAERWTQESSNVFSSTAQLIAATEARRSFWATSRTFICSNKATSHSSAACTCGL